MKAWMAFLVLASACGFESSSSPSGIIPDARPDDSNTNTNFGTFLSVRLTSAPSEPFELANELVIDTGADSRCDPGADNANYCVISATRFSIGATGKLRAFGTKPLILVSTSKDLFVLAGEIDVSSRLLIAGSFEAGAGAKNADTCLSLTPAPTPAAGNSGGFGGSFGGKGGNGGATEGREGGAADAILFPTELRGGCPGGDGGAGGAGGAGGGAVLIIATSMQLDGKINASGIGGKGGTQTKSGGGGGGSGGMVILDASPVMGSGIVFANGGGGGQGGSPVLGGAGENGGSSSGPTVQAPGGRNVLKDGGRGGDGSAGNVRAGDPGAVAQNQGGGGGGGGGAGFTRATGVVSQVTVAPPLTP